MLKKNKVNVLTMIKRKLKTGQVRNQQILADNELGMGLPVLIPI